MPSTRRLIGIICFAVLAAIVVPGLLDAADTQTKAPAPKPAPVATILKTDGTYLRGTIESADPDQVVIKPAPKPGQKEEADPVTVGWNQIKTVSTGMTQSKLLQAWKAEHRDQLCPTCHGDRTVICPTCKGTMHDPAAGKDCKTCKGELLVDCKTPKCKDGKIPCPNPNCLKLSEGTWVKHSDGLRWHMFGNSSHGWEFSEHHVGDVIVRDPKTGDYSDTGKCPICGGTTVIDDPVCHGTGKVPCPTCLARKDAPPCPDHCDNGRVKCPDCDGTGLKKS